VIVKVRVLPRSVEKVIEEFERLPGVGPKSAARMAYFLLRAPKERSRGLADALIEVKEKTVTCERCFNVADSNPCALCSDPHRSQVALCVVEEPLDVVALEQSGVHEGTYFVLGGVISPADGIGAEHLRMAELDRRVKGIVSELSSKNRRNPGERTVEVIIATNPSLEGEATASYIVDMLSKVVVPEGLSLSLTRLAMGLPTGADLEYADRLTLKRAMEGRTKLTAR